MATVNATRVTEDDGIELVRWLGLSETDNEGVSVRNPYTVRSVQVRGDFGVSGALSLEGSNNGTTWAPLLDIAGNPVTFSAAGIVQLDTRTVYVRPRVTAGTNVAVSVILASFTRS